MQILLVRHGIAEPRDWSGDDFNRRLTDRGDRRTQLAAQGLGRVVDRPQAILTSPKLRAARTAAILGDVFERIPEVCQALAEGSAREVRRTLGQRHEQVIMLVGHEPMLGQLAALLCQGNERPVTVEMKKAGCAVIRAPVQPDETPGAGVLVTLLPPTVLRMLDGVA